MPVHQDTNHTVMSSVVVQESEDNRADRQFLCVLGIIASVELAVLVLWLRC
jgi:hypothetical protein